MTINCNAGFSKLPQVYLIVTVYAMHLLIYATQHTHNKSYIIDEIIFKSHNYINVYLYMMVKQNVFQASKQRLWV